MSNLSKNIWKKKKNSINSKKNVLWIRERVRIYKMDIKSIAPTDGQQERERQAIILLEKLIKHNSDFGATATDIDAKHHLEKNLRDAKSLQKIMEKFKIDSVENLIEDNYKEG